MVRFCMRCFPEQVNGKISRQCERVRKRGISFNDPIEMHSKKDVVIKHVTAKCCARNDTDKKEKREKNECGQLQMDKMWY